MNKKEIVEKLNAARKNGDKTGLSIFGDLLNRVENLEISQKLTELSSAEIGKVVLKMIAERKESLANFEKAGRENLALIERADLAILETLAPKQMSAEECEQVTLAAISMISAKLKREKGNVIRKAKELGGEQVNLKVVAEVCDRVLQ